MYIIITFGFLSGLLGYFNFRNVKYYEEFMISVLIFSLFWISMQFYTSISFCINIFDHVFYFLFFGCLTSTVFIFGSKTYFYDKYVYVFTLPILYSLVFSSISFDKRQVIGLGLADRSFNVGDQKVRIDWYITGFTDQGTLAILYGKNLIFEYPKKYYQEAIHGIGKYVKDVSLLNDDTILYLDFEENSYFESDYSKVKLRKFERR